MKLATRELNTVVYSAAAVKVLKLKVNPNSLCFTLHWHDRVEIIRIKKGSMIIEYSGNNFLLKENEMMVFSPRMAHKGFTENCSVEYDVLMFDLRSFYNETAVCLKLLPQFFNGNAKFQNVISEKETIICTDKICNNENLDSLETTSLVYRLLHLLFEKHLVLFNTENKTKVIEMIDYIEENFASELSTAFLSKKFGYSSEHLCRKFKEATGVTPMTYLKIYRLEQSLKRIRVCENSISEIASQCGFSDANYFTRCFKAHYNVPPSFYRRKNGGYQ